MFHILHRIYILSWVLLVVGGAVWVYPRTGISEPLSDWYGVWQNAQGNTTQPLSSLSGKVVRILDGTSFMLRSSDHQFYSIGLLGLAVEPAKAHVRPGGNDSVELRRAKLSELVLSNDVEVAVASMDAQHRGLGIVRCGQTNVNAAMIESGRVELKREFIKGLPPREQYVLIRADRIAKERKASLSPRLAAGPMDDGPAKQDSHR